jgi:predicted HTH transcriptional regulator
MITFQAKGEEVSRKTLGKTTRKTTQKTTQKILSILKENPSASRKEIALIPRDITEDGVKYQLN